MTHALRLSIWDKNNLHTYNISAIVCNTIYIFISQYSVGTKFLSPLLLNMGQTYFFQIQVRFSTEDTLWRELETEQSLQNYLASII